jgi:hypothetical protein
MKGVMGMRACAGVLGRDDSGRAPKSYTPARSADATRPKYFASKW